MCADLSSVLIIKKIDDHEISYQQIYHEFLKNKSMENMCMHLQWFLLCIYIYFFFIWSGSTVYLYGILDQSNYPYEKNIRIPNTRIERGKRKRKKANDLGVFMADQKKKKRSFHGCISWYKVNLCSIKSELLPS